LVKEFNLIQIRYNNQGQMLYCFDNIEMDFLLNGYSFAQGLPRLDGNAFFQDLCAGKSIAGGRGTGDAVCSIAHNPHLFFFYTVNQNIKINRCW